MRARPSRHLIYVWVFLTIITIASWLIGRGHGMTYQIGPAVTAAVLAIAAIKALLVFRYFMEVQVGPTWLKYTIYGWGVGLPTLLLAAYWSGV